MSDFKGKFGRIPQFGQRPPLSPTPDVGWGTDEGRSARHINPKTNQVERPLTGAPENNRGHSVLFTLEAAAAPGDITVLPIRNIVESPKNGGQDSEDIRVTCGAQLDVPINPVFYSSSESLDITGVLEWGTGGASFTTEFDWTNGTSFPVAASVVQVKAIVSYTVASKRKLRLSAALGYGNNSAVKASPAKRTIYLGSIPPGAVLDITANPLLTKYLTIPPFAIGLALASSANDGGFSPLPGAPNWGIIMSGSGGITAPFPFIGGALASYTWTSSDNTAQLPDGTIPIPGWAKALTITNNSPLPQCLSLIYSLSL